MKTAVRYYTRSGNTKKLAEAIADALGTTALDVSVPIDEKVDLLFLGNSLYAGKPDASVNEFIEKNADKIGCIVNFGSSASLRSTLKKIQALGDSNSVKVCSDEFVCPGSFLFMHKGHPNESDLEAAKAFALKFNTD